MQDHAFSSPTFSISAILSVISPTFPVLHPPLQFDLTFSTLAKWSFSRTNFQFPWCQDPEVVIIKQESISFIKEQYKMFSDFTETEKN